MAARARASIVDVASRDIARPVFYMVTIKKEDKFKIAARNTMFRTNVSTGQHCGESEAGDRAGLTACSR